MKNKKILSVVLAVALVASLAVGMTVAYLQDTDSDVNVMTMGNVYIKQNEQERVDTNELADAANKGMDLIVCASISRFARNISTLVEEVRKLKTTNPSHPVGVYFETEDIYTLDPNINERLQMQGLFAEWESGNKSRRMILSYDQRICTGQFPLSDLLGLRHTIEGGFIIQEDEAITVKYIFIATKT